LSVAVRADAVLEEARKRRALYGVMLSVFLAAMESTVVATAMPRVVASLGGVQIYSWVFSAFLVTSTVTMPLWGRLSDLFGRRPVYLSGLGVFLLGSALAGLSQNMAELIAFRALQGLGAGSLMTLGMTIIGELFGLEQRARMQGYVSSMWGVASLLGPLLGGLLTDLGSWRWVFYVNLPFGAVAIALLAGALPEAMTRRRHAFDWTGVVLFTAAVSALLVGILEAGRAGAWMGGDVVVPLGVADTNVRPAGSRSVTVTLVAPSGPLLVKVTV
jgi:MFS family permease